MKSVFTRVMAAVARRTLLIAATVGCALALAHSVGQVQTTKFLAPETVNMLLARAGTASPGLQVGDVVSYIIQFSPVGNGANVGVAGFITDYIPPGTEVVGAAIVAKDSLGNFYNIPPAFPGGIDLGWGNQNQKTFLTPFATAAYDASGRCAAAGFTNNCNARMTELHADTGIFFSTDPRTAVFPALPTRILQGVNGYDISPTAEGQLNPIIGQARATTHNLWDANQTNAFGSTPAAVAALVAPASTAPSISVTGRGATPYNTGSAVAGPQSGYQLDNTASVGPWQRIAYAGSRIGDGALGPATVAGISNTAVGGAPTSIGYSLSSINPLPAGTNAVRWAVGKLVVGEIRYVKINLRISAPVPSSGIVNSSEVFGGDAGDADAGQDNVWRYHVPSVADSNSNLLVQKSVVCVYNALNVCVPSDGSIVPASSKVRYRITYLNSGALPQTNVVLQDMLPCQTAANAASNITIVSGSVTLPSPNPPITAAGNCGTTPDTRSTVTFPALATLPAGGVGSVDIDVQNNANAGSLLVNTAKLSSAQLPLGVTANAISNVGALANLAITKAANSTSTVPGGTTSYSIVVTNLGAGNATAITLTDVLPSLGGAANPATRFSLNTAAPVVVVISSGSSVTLPVVGSTVVPPTLAPYDALPVASNSQQINWSLGASTLLPGGVMTLTYTVDVGVSMIASATPYYNSAVVQYSGGSSGRSDIPNTAPVLVTSPLSVTKTIECYFEGASCVAIGPGGSIPPSAKIRYRIDYANNGPAPIANAILSDTLACQTAANAVSNIQIIAGPIGLPAPNPPTTAAGTCPGIRSTFSFPATTLPAGQTGTVKLDVSTTAAVGAVVANTAGLSAAGFASTSSEVQASVAAQPVLSIRKVANTAAVAPGGTLSYTITMTNIGTTAAQTISLYDWLPTGTSTVADVTRRFSYLSTSSVVGLTSVAPTVNLPPTQLPYSNPSLNIFAANQEEVVWNFGSQTLAPGASASLTFVAQVGANLPVSPPSYDNYARASFSGGAANSGAAAASVMLIAYLNVNKTNNNTTLVAGSTTSYTVTFTNGGPSAANGALIQDFSSAGLQCTLVTCVATTGTASCPTSMLPLGTAVPRALTNFFGAGETIASFPANSSVDLQVVCEVLATGQ